MTIQVDPFNQYPARAHREFQSLAQHVIDLLQHHSYSRTMTMTERLSAGTGRKCTEKEQYFDNGKLHTVDGNEVNETYPLAVIEDPYQHGTIHLFPMWVLAINSGAYSKVIKL